jgi:hypothetical protein
MRAWKSKFLMGISLIVLGSCQPTNQQLQGLWFGIDTSETSIVLEFLPDNQFNLLHNSSPIFKLKRQSTRYKVARLNPLELQLFLHPSGEKLGKLQIDLLHPDSLKLVYTIRDAYQDTVAMRRLRR